MRRTYERLCQVEFHSEAPVNVDFSTFPLSRGIF